LQIPDHPGHLEYREGQSDAGHCKVLPPCAIIAPVKTRIMKSNQEGIEAAGEILRRGGIVAFPTDTVYGLGAVYSDAQAVRKIFSAKGRPEEKPLSILVSSIQQVQLLADGISDDARLLMDTYWPGGLTLIFRMKQEAGIPREVSAGGETIGIRMPDSDTAIRIIAEAGAPVAAPSANLSGRRSASTAEEVKEDLLGRVDLIIDGGRCPVGVSSTVLDLSQGRIRILREGSITEAMIRDTLERRRSS